MKIIKPGETTFIYVLLDPISNEVRYIGKSDNPKNRLAEHIKKSIYKSTYKNKWIQYLLKKSLKPVIEIIDEVRQEDWSFWEKHYISLYKSWGFKLTNSAEGGNGGNLGDLVNKKISEKLKGRVLSDEWKKNISKSHIGKKHTEDTINKMSKQRIGNNYALGSKHSEEFKSYRKSVV